MLLFELNKQLLKNPVTKELAYNLSKLTGSSPELWINLQAAFDLKIKE